MNYLPFKKGFKTYIRLERGLSNNTIAAYMHDVDLLFDFLTSQKGGQSLSDISYSDLKDFIAFINEMGLGSYSQARVISGIRVFFKYLDLEKAIGNDPSEMLESPKLGSKLPDVLDISEIIQIINTIDLSLPEGQRNRAIIETLYGCGLRVSELINLKLSELYFNEGILLVTGKGNKQRFIPVGDEAKKSILLYLKYDRVKISPTKGNEDILFLSRRGGKLSRQMIFIMIKKMVEKTGIRKKISPHTFRHSFATHLVQNGADLKAVQDLLGHASIITTEIYTHLNREDLRRAILTYHPRNQKEE
ncbi:MAG: site-specific tyrosine recombinase XerD [Bacteroidetes bacterium]|nr:MAG: site-specific tyrosine recombinase XerD [Bacteroidota bacterium]